MNFNFEPYTTGPKASPTGFFINGVDLADLYAPLSLGQPGPATGFFVGSVDLASIFAVKGSVQATVPWAGLIATREFNEPATASLLFKPDGTFEASDRTGIWANNPAELEVQAVFSSGDALTYNDLASFVPITAGRGFGLVAVAGSNSAVTKTCTVNVTVRRIAAPSQSTTSVVTLQAIAEAWGTGYPP